MRLDNLIEPDVINGKPFIFVSYSRKDSEKVQEILSILRRNHFRFWYDMGMKSGDEWVEELASMIQQCSQFIVLMTPNALESKYVRKEVKFAVSSKEEGEVSVLYLQSTQLTAGFKMLLGDIHAIHLENTSSQNYLEKVVCENALMKTRDVENENESSSAFQKMQNNYVLEKQIGSGSFANVYLSTHKRTGAKVVLKCGVIDNTYCGSLIREAFEAEKDILVDALHNSCPNVPQIYDWYEDDTSVCLAETYFDGVALNERRNYSEREVVEIAIRVLNILKNLHRNQIIYRDIKPQNIIMDYQDNIYLVDFNSARWYMNLDDPEIALGTIGFAAPEQFVKDGSMHTNNSTDIYSLGRTMEYLLCQEHFEKKRVTPIRYWRKDVSASLENIIYKMQEPLQEKRYQSAEEVLLVLEKYRNSSKPVNVWDTIQSEKRIQEYKKGGNNLFNYQPIPNYNTELVNVQGEAVSVDSNQFMGQGFYDTTILNERDYPEEIIQSMGIPNMPVVSPANEVSPTVVTPVIPANHEKLPPPVLPSLEK